MDSAGAVVGMLLPAQSKDGKQLPAGVAFAASAGAIAQVLAKAQSPTLMLTAAQGGLAANPDVLNAAVRDMTVLVSCWE